MRTKEEIGSKNSIHKTEYKIYNIRVKPKMYRQLGIHNRK